MEPVLQNLQNPGPINFEGYQQAIATARQQKFLNQRERFQADQKEMNRQQHEGDLLEKQLDDKNFLSGSDEDPSILQDLAGIRQKAIESHLAGKRWQDIQAEMTPALSQLEQKRQKAQFINNDINATVKRLGKDPGYDTDELTRSARKAAFYNQDPKTGEYSLKDTNDIDPTHDYVNQAINSNPNVANFSGVQSYAKNAPHSTYDNDVTSITGPGKSNTSRLTVTAPSYMTSDRDDTTGQPNLDKPQMVPKYETITGDDGKPIGRALDKGVMNDIVSKYPSSLAAAKHETEQHFKQISPDKEISWNDPKVDMYMRHVMYDELSRNNNSIVRTKDVDKQSAESSKLENQNEEIKFAVKKENAVQQVKQHFKDLNNDDDDTPKNRKGTTMDAFGQVLTGKVDVSEGDVKKIDGEDMKNVLPFLPGGKLKSGSGERSDYEGVYMGESGRLFTQKKDEKPKEVTNVKHFITQIAESNGLPITKVKDLIQKYNIKESMKKADKPAWQKEGEEEFNKRLGGLQQYFPNLPPPNGK